MTSIGPLFGRNNNGGQGGWGDADNLDVDLLAEYLLDDSDLQPNSVTFDINQTANAGTGSVVSPEVSEDGKHPPLADTSAPTAVPKFNAVHSIQLQGGQVPQAMAQAAMALPMASGPGMATFAPGPSPSPNVNLAAAMGTMQQPQQIQLAGLLGQQPGAIQPGSILPANMQPQTLQQPQPATNMQPAGNVAKRRRFDAPVQAAMVVAAPGAAAAVAGGPMPLMGGVPVMNSLQLAAAAEEAIQQGRGGRKKSQAQIDRRRERNRILARRTRLRKKFFFESLQKEVMDLQKENERLKGIVKENIEGDESKTILDDCDAAEKLPQAVLEACGEHVDDMDRQDFNLVRSIQSSQHSFVITDPSLQDNPIVFASDDFLKLTGYSREQVLGRNCRFLQGTETSQEKVDQVRKAVANGEDVTVTMINYKSDGTAFWNKLFIAALRDAQNNIVNFIGVIVKVASPDPGDPEHGKLLPGEKKTEDDFGDGDFDDED